MGPSWRDVKHVQLLDPREVAEEKIWDEEFKKRQKEILLQRRRAEERRSRTSAKLSELSARWRRLETKRVNRSEEYLERLRTSLSLMSVRDNSTLSPHSVR